MDSITVTIEASTLRDAFERAAQELFKSTYSNPLKDVLEKAVKAQTPQIEKIVNEIIVDAIGKPEFKERMANIVIENLVAAALKKN